MIETMRNDWAKYVSDKEALQIFKTGYKKGSSYLITLYIMQILTFVYFNLEPYIFHNFEILPLPFRYPYIPINTNFGYIITYIFHSVAIYYMITYLYYMMAIFVTFTLYLCTQIEYQVYRLKAEGLKLANFCKKHISLLIFVKKISQIYMVFSIILSTNASLYLCIEIFTMNKVRILIAFTSGMFYIILLSFCGQLVTDGFEKLHSKISEINWEEYNMKDRREYLMLLIGLHKEVKVSFPIGNFSFGTLMKVILNGLV